MKKLAVVALLGLMFNVYGQTQKNVVISDINSNPVPDNSAILKLESSSRGFLMPVMTYTQMSMIQNPTAGLIVYCSDMSIYYYYNGTKWLPLSQSIKYNPNTTQIEYYNPTTMSWEGIGGKTSLQDAYDNGRSISAGNGPIVFNSSIDTAATLRLSNNNGVAAILANKSTTSANPALLVGTYSPNSNAIFAANMSGNTKTPLIYSEISSSYSDVDNGNFVSGILTYAKGPKSCGIISYVDGTAQTGSIPIVGVNYRSDGGSAIFGKGNVYGVSGESYAQAGGIGTIGVAVNGGGIGVLGSSGISGYIMDKNNPTASVGVNAGGIDYGVYASGGSVGVYGGIIDASYNPIARGYLGLDDGTYYYGVYGEGDFGIVGLGATGVYGATTTGDPAIYADGDLAATGTKSFMIDHPLDPKNKILKHFCLESNEVLNVYRGNVKLDNNGEAIVTLPNYFNEINVNFSYNLTCVGEYTPLYVKEKIKDNKFIIKGEKPNVEVSWTVYAQRNDLYIKKYPNSSKSEIEKKDTQKGLYLRPDLYGEDSSKKIYNVKGNISKDNSLRRGISREGSLKNSDNLRKLNNR